MPYWNISGINATNYDTLYVTVGTSFPWLMPLVLFFEFMVIMLSGVVTQNRRIGFSNVPMWGTIAGLVTTTSAFFWSVVSAGVNGQVFTLINLSTIVMCIAVSSGFALWFFLSSDD